MVAVVVAVVQVIEALVWWLKWLIDLGRMVFMLMIKRAVRKWKTFSYRAYKRVASDEVLLSLNVLEMQCECVNRHTFTTISHILLYIVSMWSKNTRRKKCCSLCSSIRFWLLLLFHCGKSRQQKICPRHNVLYNLRTEGDREREIEEHFPIRWLKFCACTRKKNYR